MHWCIEIKINALEIHQFTFHSFSAFFIQIKEVNKNNKEDSNRYYVQGTRAICAIEG